MKGIEMKNLRVLTLAIVALLALTGASAASAAEYTSESTSGTTYFTNTNEGNFVLKAGSTLTCTSFTGEGSFPGTAAKEVEITNIALTGCTLAGQAATVKMNGCGFLLEQPTGTSSPFSLPGARIQCPPGVMIVITATTSGCTVKVGPQAPGSSSSIVNNAGPPPTITITGGWSGITYTGSGGVCGGSGNTGTSTWKSIKRFFSDLLHTKQVGGKVK